MGENIQNVNYRLRKRGLADKRWLELHDKGIRSNGFCAYWAEGHVIIEFSASNEDEFYEQLKAAIKMMQEDFFNSLVSSLLEVRTITGEWKSPVDNTGVEVYVPTPIPPTKGMELYEKVTKLLKDEEMLIKNEDKKLYERCLEMDKNYKAKFIWEN
ncbi:MAG: hypothetical protein FWG01_02465 [Betaproteobacteria bacterium]|nr:hypothetical protein [Betaproteobacteria bacterium]